MNSTTQASFEFARDTTRQMITISAAIIGGTVAFAEDILGTPSTWQMIFLVASWLAFLLTVFFCIWTLLALTGSLANSDEATSSLLLTERDAAPLASDQKGIYGSNIQIPAACQLVTFFVGLTFTVVLGVSSVCS